MSAQILVALLNPQLHIAALIVAALVIVCVYGLRYYCQMDPELAKVRALQKIINRTLPKRRCGDDSTGSDWLQSVITALGAVSAAAPVANALENDRRVAAEVSSENQAATLDDP